VGTDNKKVGGRAVTHLHTGLCVLTAPLAPMLRLSPGTNVAATHPHHVHREPGHLLRWGPHTGIGDRGRLPLLFIYRL